MHDHVALDKLLHDLRSPLMGITGALSVMEACFEDGLPAHGQRALDAGLRAVDTLNAMLDELGRTLLASGFTAERTELGTTVLHAGAGEAHDAS